MRKRKIISMILVITMLVISSSGAFADSLIEIPSGKEELLRIDGHDQYTEVVSMTYAENEQQLLLDNENLDSRIITYISARICADKQNIKISSIKELEDFSGNRYKLVECDPCGYFILIPEVGVTIEYSYSAQSPYHEYDDNLFYLGPTYYYIESDEEDSNIIGNPERRFVHTVLPTEVVSLCDETVRQSQELYDAYSSMEVDWVQEYINNTNEDISIPSSFSAMLSSTLVSESTYPDYEWFSELDSFGYVSGDHCGYVAANIVLKYWHHSAGAIVLPNLHKTISSTALTNALVAEGAVLGYNTTISTGTKIRNVINAYLDEYGIDGSASYAFSSYNVTNEIANGRPVILFGSLNDPTPNSSNNINHAVVVYSYYFGSDGYTTLVCHYGWEDYSEVCVTGADSYFGGQTRYDPYA